MPAKRFTDRWLKAHRAAGREEWSDAQVPGLLVRFGPSGAVFYARFRAAGRVRRERLGLFREEISLATARERARELLAGRGRRRGAPGSFAVALEGFLEHVERRGEASAAETARVLRANALPAWRERSLRSLGARDVAELLEAAVARGAPVQANRLRAHLVRFFRWAIEHELCDANPALVVRRPHREQARERVLDDTEIVALWRVLELRHPTIRHLFRFLLLTGLRPSEGRLLAWSEVTRDELRLPPARTKARREHRLPLPPLAAEQLAAQRALELGGPLVFPSPRNAPAPLDVSSLSHHARALAPRLGFSFRPHDLRRTCASGLARLGASRLVVRRVLAHADAEVTDRYDRHDHLEAVREALGRWADHVRALVARAPKSRSPRTQAWTSEKRQPTQ